MLLLETGLESMCLLFKVVVLENDLVAFVFNVRLALLNVSLQKLERCVHLEAPLFIKSNLMPPLLDCGLIRLLLKGHLKKMGLRVVDSTLPCDEFVGDLVLLSSYLRGLPTRKHSASSALIARSRSGESYGELIV